MTENGRLASSEQLASVVSSTVSDGAAAGCRAVDVRVWGGIDMRLLPDRGLDVAAAWFRGTPLAWLSALGEQPPLRVEELVGERWGEAWPGGLVTTCGLSNVGAPTEGHGLHGTYSHRRAGEIASERAERSIAVSAVIEDPPFRVVRRVATSLGAGLLRLDDAVVNDSEWTAAAPLLYGVNLGFPLWGPEAWAETDAAEVVPPGAEAWDVAPEPVAGATDRVYEHVGASWARVTNRAAGVEVTIRSSLPRLWQTVQPSAGALSVQFANCSLLGREADLESGHMHFLDPGEERESWLAIEARSIG